MTDGSPTLEDVADALPARAIDVSEIYRLTVGNAGELVFIPAGTVRVEGGVRVAAVAVHHGATDHRYLVGWDRDGGRWVGINDWQSGEFEPFELEYDVDDWLERLETK